MLLFIRVFNLQAIRTTEQIRRSNVYAGKLFLVQTEERRARGQVPARRCPAAGSASTMPASAAGPAGSAAGPAARRVPCSAEGAGPGDAPGSPMSSSTAVAARPHSASAKAARDSSQHTRVPRVSLNMCGFGLESCRQILISK